MLNLIKKSEIVRMMLLFFVCLLLAVIGGCADWSNKAKNNGGYFTTHKADYIVVSQSGGQIMDVWKLRDVFVSSPNGSDGWIFTDTDGNSVTTGGDCKNIRINKDNSGIWEKYNEYHMEFSSRTYREMYNPE